MRHRALLPDVLNAAVSGPVAMMCAFPPRFGGRRGYFSALITIRQAFPSTKYCLAAAWTSAVVMAW